MKVDKTFYKSTYGSFGKSNNACSEDKTVSNRLSILVETKHQFFHDGRQGDAVLCIPQDYVCYCFVWVTMGSQETETYFSWIWHRT